MPQVIPRAGVAAPTLAFPIGQGASIGPRLEKPMVRVRYELKEVSTPDLEEILKARLQ